MRIAHIVSTFPPYQGGMGNVAAAWQRELLRLGHDCDVLTPWYGAYGEAPESEPRVHRIRPFLHFGNAAFVPKLRKHLSEYDVLHLHYPFFGGAETIAWHKHRHAGQRLVVTYHMDTIGPDWRAAVFALYRATFMPWILSQADAITVSSLDYARHSALRHRLGRWPVHELPFGVDEEYTPVARPGLREDGVLHLLFVGALDAPHYFKGLLDLFEALRLARLGGVPLFLTVVGDGDMRADYEAEAGRLGIQKHVLFTGRVSRERLIESYRQADVLALPSVDRSEAFGLVLAEAMACGTPVIASDLPGVRTVPEPGKTGWLSAPRSPQGLADTLQTIWHQRDRLPQMRQAAAKRADTLYRWPGITRRLLELYQP